MRSISPSPARRCWGASARRTSGSAITSRNTTSSSPWTPAALRRNSSLVAFEKFYLQLILQILDLTAKRGLRDVQSLGRATEAQIFSDADEVSKVPKFHKLLPHRSQTKWRGSIRNCERRERL